MGERVTAAILASGDPESGVGGSTMQRFIEDAAEGVVDVDVELVICNNSVRKVPGFYKRIDDLNQRYGLRIRAVNISSITHPGGPQPQGQTQQEAEAILTATHDLDFIFMLGYMKKVNDPLMAVRGWREEYAERYPETRGLYVPSLTNNHPSKLPETAGTHGPGAHWRALELGLPFSAYTLQVAAPEIDAGPTIEEHLVPITDEMRALWNTGDETKMEKARDMLKDDVMDKEKEQTAPAIGRWMVARQEFWQNAA